MDVLELDEFFAKFDGIRTVGEVIGHFHADEITETCKGKFREKFAVVDLNPAPSSRGTDERATTLQEITLDENRQGEHQRSFHDNEPARS